MNSSPVAKGKKHFGMMIVHILLIVAGFVWVYPFLWMLAASFKTSEEFFSKGLSLIPASFNLANFIRAWNAAKFSQCFANTLVITASVVAIVLIVSAMAGYVVGRYSFKGKNMVMGIFVASMFIPLGFTIIPIFEIIKMMGLLNTRLGIILAESGGSHIVFILLFAAFFKQIPNELEEAAWLDGCGFFRNFVQIMLPLSKPVIGSVIIMQFIWTWNSFFLPLVLSLSNSKLWTLAVGLYALKGEYVVDWTGIAAGGSIALVPIIIVFLFLQRYFVEGIAGAVKS
ncbi:raffinose/stachyose/melibiose transport system permease protein [Hydrogenispora ethanolica]|jgi:ABC-type glycerol-3-phosphate transport system permease component|uniref:Raffinose/stachyose/melibiose transport system permease protein n=1 Tax=Hydrogenispora ethanolica TaxID=1082276 RepID=A0A4R1RM96_HYDET|nr:carbohydrate ABC transporter permease [Hydrogenispora ethanolica]TCL67385.1 raffinose/stachyose/melibiose transport system permease protein [Hydrogenispora ethanolica]